MLPKTMGYFTITPFELLSTTLLFLALIVPICPCIMNFLLPNSINSWFSGSKATIAPSAEPNIKRLLLKGAGMIWVKLAQTKSVSIKELGSEISENCRSPLSGSTLQKVNDPLLPTVQNWISLSCLLTII